MKSRHEGTFEIVDGEISLPLLEGQYFLVEGSILNDGIYQYPGRLKDEKFDGAIVGLAIPKDFLDLVEEITAFCAGAQDGPYVSESFGGYSYTKATDSNGNVASWKQVFATRLNTWRKI